MGGNLFITSYLSAGSYLLFVHHSTGLVVSNFFRSMEIPCSLYISDRHNGQFQILPNQGAYANLANLDGHILAAAKSAISLEISRWLFLRTWDDPLPWRDERHIRISLATDASASGWGGSVTLSDRTVEASDYWMKEE